jgi:hypothetical protein
MSPIERALLAGLVDYAGLFPPAGLGMQETVANFAAYQTRPDAYALARLVIPISRLAEFEEAWAGLDATTARAARWPISALASADLAQDFGIIERFNGRHSATSQRVESVELRIVSAREAEQAKPLLAAGLEVYCELPLSADLPALVVAVKRAGARAKIRTGGVKLGDIPAPEAVLAFLTACAAERLPFKATAGLHHPVRGPAPLTYEPGSVCDTMFGFLNIVLAATLLWSNGPEHEALALLSADRSAGLRFVPDAVEWAGVRVSAADIARARREFMLAMGSCSFTEPMGEIRAHGLDPERGPLPAVLSRSIP